jgi:hypothetical protein
MRLSSTKFRNPIEAIMSVEVLAALVNELGCVRFRIAPGVFCNAFVPSTGVYVREANSLRELIHLFAEASGLTWKIDVDEAVELYRTSCGEKQNLCSPIGRLQSGVRKLDIRGQSTWRQR